MGTHPIFESDFDCLTESDKKRAADELNEDENSFDKISNLRDMIKSADWYDSVLEPRLDDQYLMRYLRVAKFDLAVSLERLEKMFKIQKEWKEVFDDFSFSSIEDLFRGDHGTLFQVMPSRDVNDGSIIVYGRPGNIKPEHFNLHRMYKSAIFLWEVLLLGDPVQIGGLK